LRLIQATGISALLAGFDASKREKRAMAAWITRVLPGFQDGYKLDDSDGDGSVDLVLPSDFQTNIDASTAMAYQHGIPVTFEGDLQQFQIHGKMNGGGQPYHSVRAMARFAEQGLSESLISRNARG